MKVDNPIVPFGCRHGLLLVFDPTLLQFLVWDPITGQLHHLAIPRVFDLAKATFNGEVLRSAAGDVHFKVVLVVADFKDKLNSRRLACVYSSQSGLWGNLISTPIPSWHSLGVFANSGVLVGDSLYWDVIGSSSSDIIEFDLERESLSTIPVSDAVPSFTAMRLMQTEGGGLGLLTVLGSTAQLWKRKAGSDGIISWVLGRTIELEKLLSLNSEEVRSPLRILGFAEDNNLVLLWTGVKLFTVQLESLQFKQLPKPEILYDHHPFECVYAAGI